MADTRSQRWESTAPLGTEPAWHGAHLQPGAGWHARSAPMFSSAPRPARVLVGGAATPHTTLQGRDDHGAQTAVERLAKGHRQMLICAWLCTWLAMAGFVGLYGWGPVGTGVAAEMLQMFYGGAALACAMAVVCLSVLLADWFTDYALAVEDARNYERDPAMFMQRYSSVVGPAAT